MKRLGPVVIGMLTIATALLSGCERSEEPTTTSKPPQTAAASTQPSADEMANVRELVQNMDQRGAANLPAGHPPIGNPPEKPTMPELPTAPQPAVKLQYTPPDTWQKEPVKSAMRHDQYRLPRAEGDPEDGELAVFGAGVGGGIAANVQRWRGQFSTPDGQPLPDEAVVQQTLEVGGLKITVVDIAGRYNTGGMMPGAPAEPKDDYRMLGAIVETPGGLWYFKAVGPANTIGQHRDAFMEFLRSMRVEQ
jgi:hypothetical protein